MTGSTAALQLPPHTAELIAQVDSGQVLGASRQLQLIGDALVSLAHEKLDEPTLPSILHDLVDHLVETRGASSQAIVNGLRLMAGPALAAGDDHRHIANCIITGVTAFTPTLQSWLRAVDTHGTILLRGARTVLAYDYSSSVASLISTAAGDNPDLTVVIPEARSLDGGRKYLRDWSGLRLRLHIVPDAAISWALRDCDLMLAGSETLTMDGGCYNTIGTEFAARVAAQHGIPVYVVSILLKTDTTLGADEQRPVPLLDFSAQLSWDDPAADPTWYQFDFPDLDYTPPELITGLITERGILKPSELRAAVPAALLPAAPDAGGGDA